MRRVACSTFTRVPTSSLLPAAATGLRSAMGMRFQSGGMQRFRFGSAATGHSASLVATAVGNTVTLRFFSRSSLRLTEKKPENAVGSFNQMQNWKEEEKQNHEEEADNGNAGPDPGYLPFPPPFHTVNVISLLLLGNLLIYLIMSFGNDDTRDFLVEHFTLSHENAHRLYPFLTHAFYQENFLQLAIDSWLLAQFGRTMFGFLGGARLLAFWTMCQIGGGLIHVGRQYAQLYYDMDPLEVRGRCFGANPFIMGLVSVEGLIFRNLNLSQNPPIPFLVLTAFVMVIDIWRIFTTKPEEHGASTGGALIAYFFWAMPTRRLGLDKLTAKM